eukprot:Colp12_sorted_trinity150504_noHs@26789
MAQAKAGPKKYSVAPTVGHGEEAAEMHLKMSKKIAQLTKVIYHLNTLNDEHEAELAELTETYEAEILAITQDAEQRIAKYKEMFDTERKGLLTESENKMLLDFQEFKAKAAEREENMKQTYKRQTTEMAEELEKMRKLFESRLQSFAEISKLMEKNQTLSVEELKKTHQQ